MIPRYGPQRQRRCQPRSRESTEQLQLRQHRRRKQGPRLLLRKELCSWTKRQFGVDRNFILNNMYTVTLASWLIVFSGDRHTRLEYQKVWDSGDAIRLMMVVWNKSLKLDDVRAARVHGKVLRFLDTNWVFPTRRCFIAVPTNSTYVFQMVKKTFKRLLMSMRQNSYYELSKFLQFRTRIVSPHES